MSYLNRENNYGVKKARSKVARVKIGDRTEYPWWRDCNVCPILTGFGTYRTHAEALTGANNHMREYHCGNA